MLFSKFNQALSGDYVHVRNLSQNEIDVNEKYAAKNHHQTNTVVEVFILPPRTGVSRGHSRREETSPARKPGKTYPAEGPNTEKGRTSMSSHDIMNPYGGVPMGRIVESSL